MIKEASLCFRIGIQTCSDIRGSAALEAALIFPILFSLIFTIVDAGRLMITDSLLQTALGSLSRDFRYSNADGNRSLTTGYALLFIKRNLGSRTPGWIDEEKLTLTITSNQDLSLGPCRDMEGRCSLVELVYPFSTTIPIAGLFFTEDVLLRKSRAHVLSNWKEAAG